MRTLTFTFEDALISAESFSVLSGAGLVSPSETPDGAIYQHVTSRVKATADNTIILKDVLACWTTMPTGATGNHFKNEGADMFCMTLDKDGQIDAEPCVPAKVEHIAGDTGVEKKDTKITCYAHGGTSTTLPAGTMVLVDYYVAKTTNTQQIEITADKFGGNYYLEASTLFRRESDGKDMPAEFIIPNGRIQSNFTFTMASSGDPSTFTFTMDAFPDYTKFDKTKKVLAAIQIIDDSMTGEDKPREKCTAVAEGE